MKNKKATINPISKSDNKYFHYTVVSLNYQEIEKRLRKNIENQTFCIVDKFKPKSSLKLGFLLFSQVWFISFL